jgi:SAM-dependent methyltransferase
LSNNQRVRVLGPPTDVDEHAVASVPVRSGGAKAETLGSTPVVEQPPNGECEPLDDSTSTNYECVGRWRIERYCSAVSVDCGVAVSYHGAGTWHSLGFYLNSCVASISVAHLLKLGLPRTVRHRFWTRRRYNHRPRSCTPLQSRARYGSSRRGQSRQLGRARAGPRRVVHYDVNGWLTSGQGPRPDELDALGDVSGLDLVHLQCHFGMDTLAFARVGARVTGIDFSPVAIAEARLLAERAGLTDCAEFVEADALDAASALNGQAFDIVYVSLGALCWLPSITRWADQVAALLRPGGRLYLHDVHPLTLAVADDDLRFEHSYFEEAQPISYDEVTTYTDGDGTLVNTRTYEWNHSIGEIVTAVLAHGLHIDTLIEQDWTTWPRFPWLIQTGNRHWQAPDSKPRVPLSFTLVATCRT